MFIFKRKWFEKNRLSALQIVEELGCRAAPKPLRREFTRLWIITAALFLFSGCYKYEVQFEGPYSDEENSSTLEANWEILFVQNGLLKLTDAQLRFVKTMTGINNVELASINYAHDKIAYKTPGNNVVVIDTSGQQLEIVPNSASVSWFDFHANDATIYMLENNQLRFHGPAIQVDQTNLTATLPFPAINPQIGGVAVTQNGTLIVGYQYYDGLFVQYGVAVDFPNDGGQSDYRKTIQYTNTIHFRTNPSGEQCTFNKVNGIDSEDVFRININTQQLFNLTDGFFSSTPFRGTYAADGERFVYGSTYLSLENGEQILELSDSPITTLDW
jgi:hypothetical protein